ncbi:MAG: hypothetical protein AABX12_03800 [Nanoarchaeota archaeon]
MEIAVYISSLPHLYHSGILAFLRRRPSVAPVEESGHLGNSTEHREASREPARGYYSRINNRARVVRHPARYLGENLDTSG